MGGGGPWGSGGAADRAVAPSSGGGGAMPGGPSRVPVLGSITPWPGGGGGGGWLRSAWVGGGPTVGTPMSSLWGARGGWKTGGGPQKGGGPTRRGRSMPGASGL